MRLMRLPEVERVTGYKRSSIYALAARGEFPQPVKLGRRASAWVEAEINTWIEQRVEASREAS